MASHKSNSPDDNLPHDFQWAFASFWWGLCCRGLNLSRRTSAWYFPPAKRNSNKAKCVEQISFMKGRHQQTTCDFHRLWVHKTSAIWIHFLCRFLRESQHFIEPRRVWIFHLYSLVGKVIITFEYLSWLLRPVHLISLTEYFFHVNIFPAHRFSRLPTFLFLCAKIGLHELIFC